MARHFDAYSKHCASCSFWQGAREIRKTGVMGIYAEQSSFGICVVDPPTKSPKQANMTCQKFSPVWKR